MKVLVTGAKGFIGRNLCAALRNVRDGKDRRARFEGLLPLEVFEYDVQSGREQLEAFAASADFVFNLAGVNRPEDASEFMEGNCGFLSELLGVLERSGNACPVMLASSAQASLEGRYEGSEYGKSKLAAEELLREYDRSTGAPVLIYRLPNVYGKWCRPNYNSAVATFCHQIAHGLPVTVNDPSVELELLYIDDLVEELLGALADCVVGKPCASEDGFCHAGPTDRAALGQIVGLLEGFRDARLSLEVPDAAEGSFAKKLHATYLSYLDPSDFSYGLSPKADERGCFAEFLRTPERGQVSVNVCKPGQTKGNHWHNTKWEKFLVVSGEGVIRQRRVGADADGNPHPIVERRVSGEDLVVVDTIPGYAHSIANVSNDQDLVVVIWASECFDPERPDTFYEVV